jgi:hypothetical protein
MLHFSNDNLHRAMTKTEIRERAPYVFAEAPTNPGVSDRYVMATTETIIDDMAKLGWDVVDCKQQRANKRSKVRSFHMVAFQNPKVFITKENADGTESVDCFPRIILTNSHDGFHSFKFMVGLFRLVCSNGLVVATEQFADVSIRHINYTFSELREMVAKAITTVSDNISVMNEMQNTILNDEQKKALATEALKIRGGDNDDKPLKVADDDLEDILTPTRDEDNANDLWTVFNVLQEKIIKGNFKMISPTNNKVRKARPITGLAKDLEINQALFRYASEMRAAA